ncbi:folate-binding protein YgfZ [Homoserinimonas sp. OAct 916]|uniref:CAF17-like 4Fe-4S cluster assembly/insertion protein YgfZ n=1 Tax=Homoserinimonas sp. OAct 916 TaxID=2211450 RepID=UPI000DBE280D|nr:glycine cleavage T C-terminal barrel domain-containing protein [Homoserinimonas sp. OAct 916]
MSNNLTPDIVAVFSELPGAVTDSGLVAHYGNPVAEQRALVAGDAIVDLADRAVLTVSGEDRLTWLDSLTSQQLTGLHPGDSAETLLLDANGRIEHAVRLVDDGTTCWLLVDASQAAGLFDWLTRMRFRLRVDVVDRTADFATFGYLMDAGAAHALSPLVAASNGVPVLWSDPWSELQNGGWTYSTTTEHPGAGWKYRECLIERSRTPDVVALVREGSVPKVRAAGMLALEALRIEAWRPRLVTEVDERTVPHELDWLRSAVHLTKGCYRGQETVAKVHNIGHPPRRIVFLHLDGSESQLPSPGDEVVSGEGEDRKVVGRITSSARHHELGPIALAVVRRRTDPSATLTVETGGTLVAAAQEIIVSPDAGAEAGVPRLPRLGAVKRRPR